jgi:hypothetical protein
MGGASETAVEIGRLKSLDQDWDSYGAERIDDSAVADAMRFLLHVDVLWGAAKFVRPLVGPTPDGGVALIWGERGHGEVETRFSPRGNRYVVVRDRKVVAQGPVDDSFVKVLIDQYLRR